MKRIVTVFLLALTLCVSAVLPGMLTPSVQAEEIPDHGGIVSTDYYLSDSYKTVNNVPGSCLSVTVWGVLRGYPIPQPDPGNYYECKFRAYETFVTDSGVSAAKAILDSKYKSWFYNPVTYSAWRPYTMDHSVYQPVVTSTVRYYSVRIVDHYADGFTNTQVYNDAFGYPVNTTVKWY